MVSVLGECPKKHAILTFLIVADSQLERSKLHCEYAMIDIRMFNLQPAGFWRRYTGKIDDT
jgi:hypothetical protein